MLSILLLLLPFINIFHDNAFSSENKTLKYIFEPFLKLNGTDFYDIESNDQLQLEDFTLVLGSELTKVALMSLRILLTKEASIMKELEKI